MYVYCSTWKKKIDMVHILSICVNVVLQHINGHNLGVFSVEDIFLQIVAALISCSYFVLNAPAVLSFDLRNLNLKWLTFFDVPFFDDDDKTTDERS